MRQPCFRAILKNKARAEGPVKGASMKYFRFRPVLCVPALRLSVTALLPAMALSVALSAFPATAQQTGSTPETKPVERAAIDPATTVVATVDGEPIYLSEILLQIQQLPQEYQQAQKEHIYPPKLDRAIDSRERKSVVKGRGSKRDRQRNERD